MKIFGIGLERTATTSLVAAMQRLGFSATHFPASMLEIERDDFVDDITVAYRFEALDKLFPGSKFILTTREETSWLDSCARWHGPRGDAPMPDGGSVGFEALLALYGQTTFDPEVWLAGRRKYHLRVFDYFADGLTICCCWISAGERAGRYSALPGQGRGAGGLPAGECIPDSTSVQ